MDFMLTQAFELGRGDNFVEQLQRADRDPLQRRLGRAADDLGQQDAVDARRRTGRGR